MDSNRLPRYRWAFVPWLATALFWALVIVGLRYA
jgi:hypothetical protein